MRVSKSWIMWGGNYYTNYIPPARCFIVWDKMTGKNSYADAELALTNIDGNSKIFKKLWLGAHAEDDDGRFHPTQKPVALYKWLLTNYAKEGDKILDTHMGSQSSRIAAWHLGFDYYGCELDADYFNDGNKRFEREKMQQQLFTPEQSIISQSKLNL